MDGTMRAPLIRYKIAAWARYHQTVTDWEVDKYPRLYRALV